MSLPEKIQCTRVIDSDGLYHNMINFKYGIEKILREQGVTDKKALNDVYTQKTPLYKVEVDRSSILRRKKFNLPKQYKTETKSISPEKSKHTGSENRSVALLGEELFSNGIGFIIETSISNINTVFLKDSNTNLGKRKFVRQNENEKLEKLKKALKSRNPDTYSEIILDVITPKEIIGIIFDYTKDLKYCKNSFATFALHDLYEQYTGIKLPIFKQTVVNGKVQIEEYPKDKLKADILEYYNNGSGFWIVDQDTIRNENILAAHSNELVKEVRELYEKKKNNGEPISDLLEDAFSGKFNGDTIETINKVHNEQMKVAKERGLVTKNLSGQETEKEPSLNTNLNNNSSSQFNPKRIDTQNVNTTNNPTQRTIFTTEEGQEKIGFLKRIEERCSKLTQCFKNKVDIEIN